MVWHEALCQGPVFYAPTLDAFMALRIPFLVSQFGDEVQSASLRFRHEWEKWDDLSDYSELVLWFEYDLFCQANLLFICHHLYHHAPTDLKITLVSPASHPEMPDFRGMGQLSPAQLIGLFPDRITLARSDLAFADQVWRAWADADLAKVHLLSKHSPLHWSHLPNAIQGMLEELPAVSDNLSATERLILEFLRNSTHTPLKAGALFRHFLSNRDVLGYGDLQFFQILNGLIPDFISLINGGYAIQPTVVEQLERPFGTTRFELASVERWVGPIHITSTDNPIRWDQVNQKIVSSS